MKNKILSFLIALLLAVSAANLPAYAVHAAVVSTETEDFYQQLTDLVGKQDTSKFFGKIKLEIGSNIMLLDGEAQILDAAPEVINNRTMLPIRAVAEAAGAEVNWVQDTYTVLIKSASGDTISCAIGSPTITVNNLASQMDVIP